MGYRRVRPTYRLRFSDPELNGLIVEARGTSMAKLLDVSDAAANLDLGAIMAANDLSDLDTDVVKELFRVQRATLEPFVEALVSWNLEDEDGTPTPCTMEGLTSHDSALIQLIVEAWRDAQIGVKPPLPLPSGNGRQLPEVPMPMVPLSANPGS